MNCKICFENYDNINHKPMTLIPCGHSFCSSCVCELKTCSSCRKNISDRTPNYDLIENLDYILNYELRQSIIKDLKEVEDFNFEISLLNNKVLTEFQTTIDTAIKLIVNQIDGYKLKLLTEIDLIKNKSIPKSDCQVLQIRDIKTLDLSNMKVYKDEIKTEKLKLGHKINQIKQISIAQIKSEIADLFASPLNLSTCFDETFSFASVLTSKIKNNSSLEQQTLESQVESMSMFLIKKDQIQSAHPSFASVLTSSINTNASNKTELKIIKNIEFFNLISDVYNPKRKHCLDILSNSHYIVVFQQTNRDVACLIFDQNTVQKSNQSK